MKSFLRQKFIRDTVSGYDYLAALLLAVAASAVVYGLESLTIEKFSNISHVMIIAVLLAAVLLGKGPAILTAVVCSLIYDWLFVPPYFGVANGTDNIIKFSVFVAVALITGWIAGMAKLYAVELKQRERELMTTIDERERYKQEKEQEAVMRKAEALRNAVLTSVSHDLKTPLASIIGAMSSLKLYRHGLTEADTGHLIDSVVSEANKLHGYLNNILDVAAFEGRDARMKRETLALDDVIDLTIKRMAGTLKQHRLSIVQEVEPLMFQGDERLMDIALGNILDNAVKFSEPGTAIVIAARPDVQPGQVVLEITDEGSGVSRQEEERVFDKFYRAGKADQKNTGTGLGLWIARRIIEAHGGSIRLQGRSRQGGACVRIALPRAEEPPVWNLTQQEAV